MPNYKRRMHQQKDRHEQKKKNHREQTGFFSAIAGIFSNIQSWILSCFTVSESSAASGAEALFDKNLSKDDPIKKAKGTFKAVKKEGKSLHQKVKRERRRVQKDTDKSSLGARFFQQVQQFLGSNKQKSTSTNNFKI